MILGMYDEEARLNIARGMLESILGDTVLITLTKRDGNKELRVMREFDAGKLQERLAAGCESDVARASFTPCAGRLT